MHYICHVDDVYCCQFLPARSMLMIMMVFLLTEHHRSGIYRHSRHPLSSVEPPGERRRSSRQPAQPPPPASTASITFFTPSLTSVTESDVCTLYIRLRICSE